MITFPSAENSLWNKSWENLHVFAEEKEKENPDK